MAKRVQTIINRFDGGMVNDLRNHVPGGFAIAKHFDTLTFPNRLQPLRGMSTESTTDSKISNLIVYPISGRMYGVGTDPNNPTQGKLWVRSDSNTTVVGTSYGGSSTWRSLTTNQLSGGIQTAGTHDAFLVAYPDAGNVRTLFWASTNLLVASDPLGASSVSTQALTFSTISQGFVHPVDKILYFSYQTTTATYIGYISNNATPFASVNFTVLTLPVQYRVYHLTNYGNYLAIAATSSVSSGSVNNSVVFLWDRVSASWNETIPWGSGALKVLNNLNGVLIGISGSNLSATDAIQDYDSIQIKAWAGGDSPTLIDELPALNVIASGKTGTPSATINPNVNFVYHDRLYFSINLTLNNAASGRYGLWTVGKNQAGHYVVNMERQATNDNSETGVLGAAMAGDFVAMAHTAAGTLTATTNGAPTPTVYGATSSYESLIYNDGDSALTKKLVGVTVGNDPLPSGATITLKYRTDQNIATNAAYTTIFTNSTANTLSHAAVTIESAGATLPAYKEIQWQVQTTGYGIVTEVKWKSDIIQDEPY